MIRRALPSTLAALALLATGACDQDRRLPQARLSLEETLAGADTAGFARALEPRAFVFPQDHGPHPEFRNEWWYITGNLDGDDGRPVGFQFTIFRTSLSPDTPAEGSAWSTNQAYMAHFAVTDGGDGQFYAFERFARGSLGLAGARAEPFRVWLEDWSLESTGAPIGPGGTGSTGSTGSTGGRPDAVGQGPPTFPIRLRASAGDVALDLVLEAGKPPVFQGDRGLSQKGPEPGNASYYYAHTRMPTAGTVVLDGDTLSATGLSWMDREWSTSALSEGQVGWDWFALQLDNDWELMVYALRLSDGSVHPLSDGVLIDPDGLRHPLSWGSDVTVTPTGAWESPIDGARYPSGWRIGIPERGWDLTVTPVLPDQELDVAFRYWEGAVDVAGTGEGLPIRGRGYVELTGYAGRRPER